MKENLSKIYLILSAIIDIGWALFFGQVILLYTIETFSMEDVLLACVFFWMCIALFTINVITWKSLSRQVQFPIIKGILEKGAIFNILAAYASLNPIFDGAGAAILFGILGFLFIGALYLIGKGRKPKKNSKPYRGYGFESYEAIDYMDEATFEYLNYCGKEDIDEEDDEKIYAYASAPILYWLAWLKDNGYLVDIEIDEESPLNLFVRMDYVLRKENIKPEIMAFMNYYYFNGEVRKSAFHQPSYIVDYYNLVREENPYFYIHEFSYEVYSRFAKTIDQRYQNFRINMMEAEVYTDIEDIDFEINTFGEIETSYIRKCVESYRNLSSEQKERMREALNEYVEDDEIDSLAHFSMDEMVIFQPRGEEIAYILCGEADFEEEHGISMCMVNGIVTEVAYRMDYMNPWAFKDMEKYKAYQRGLKISQAQDKEQMDYLIQAEDFTWTYLTPLKYGGLDSQENQVLLPVDVLEALKEQEQYLDTLLVSKTIQQVYYEKTGDLWIPNSIRIVVQYPERTRIFDTIWIWQ